MEHVVILLNYMSGVDNYVAKIHINFYVCACMLSNGHTLSSWAYLLTEPTNIFYYAEIVQTEDPSTGDLVPPTVIVIVAISFAVVIIVITVLIVIFCVGNKLQDRRRKR